MNRKYRLLSLSLSLFLLLSLLLAVACRPAAAEPTPTPPPAGAIPVSPLPAGLPTGTDGQPWWNDTVYYEIFVRSFYDSDGDGVGDLNGLIEKLDYLNDGDPATTDDLGITGLWLMPIMESPSYHGYDVVDYYTVDQEYGTVEDFQRLMDEAHKRGIRVIVDLVLNHTGRDNPWFQEAQDEGDPYRDWYLWADEDPGYKGPWGETVWHPTGDEYFYGVFWEGMPDLNYRNPAVTEQMHDISRFWLQEMGVDGFRLDAVKHLIEEGQLQENTEATYAWFADYQTFYESIAPQAMVIGEVWSPTPAVVRYIDNGLDLAFEFDLAQAILNSVEDGRQDGVAAQMEKVVAGYPAGQYAVFLTNHDQNRVMSELNTNADKARLAGTILLTAPGVPFIYYGEEIGLRGIKPDEDLRRPMQWSAEENAGFTSGTPWRPPHRTYTEFNVASESSDPNSLLSHYRALVQLRSNHEALRVGDWALVETGTPKVYAFLRFSDDEVILVLLNLRDEELADYALSLPGGVLPAGALTPNTQAFMLYGSGDPAGPTISADGSFSDYQPFPSLPPYSSLILQLQPAAR